MFECLCCGILIKIRSLICSHLLICRGMEDLSKFFGTIYWYVAAWKIWANSLVPFTDMLRHGRSEQILWSHLLICRSMEDLSKFFDPIKPQICCKSQTNLSNNVVSSTPRHERDSNSQVPFWNHTVGCIQSIVTLVFKG